MQERKNDFPTALKRAREFTKRTQDDFDLVSTRSYVSLLERGLRSPTLTMVETLAEVLDLHPLTVLSLAYMTRQSRAANEKALAQVAAEVSTILAAVPQRPVASRRRSKTEPRA